MRKQFTIMDLTTNGNLKFEPLIHHTYHLYQKESEYLLSLVAPEDWGRSKTSLVYLATVKLLSDHTWEILKKSDAFNLF